MASSLNGLHFQVTHDIPPHPSTVYVPFSSTYYIDIYSETSISSNGRNGLPYISSSSGTLKPRHCAYDIEAMSVDINNDVESDCFYVLDGVVGPELKIEYHLRYPQIGESGESKRMKYVELEQPSYTLDTDAEGRILLPAKRISVPTGMADDVLVTKVILLISGIVGIGVAWNSIGYI